METRKFQVNSVVRTNDTVEHEGITYVFARLHVQIPGGLRMVAGRPQFIQPIPYWEDLALIVANEPDPQEITYSVEPDSNVSGGYRFEGYDIVLSEWNKDGADIISRHLKPQRV
jgi:hypothetical protein